VWEYDLPAMTPDHERPMVKPVLDALPVKWLNSDRLVATTLTLANGSTHLGLLHNVSLHHPAATDQFLAVTIFRDDGQRFTCFRGRRQVMEHVLPSTMARILDNRTPAGLAEFLGLRVDEIFPITYDLSAVAVGNPSVIRGTIPVHPKQTLDDGPRCDVFFDSIDTDTNRVRSYGEPPEFDDHDPRGFSK